MRIALISDMHANDIALEAVLADIDQQQIDRILCLGDVATIGPQPKQVLDRLRDLGCSCVLGNHDNALLEPDKASLYHIAPPLIPSLQWCADLLGKDDYGYLRSFKPILEVPLGGGSTMLCFHGSPRSNTDVISATTTKEKLEEFFAGYTNPIMAGGHSHVQMLRHYNGTIIINAGSVGHPFLNTPPAGSEPTLLTTSEYAIVEWAKGMISVSFRRVDFDLVTYRSIISRSDIPIKSWLLGQYVTKNIV